jgi:cell division protein FtsB
MLTTSHPFKETAQTVGHGLGGAPSWVYKKREAELTSSYESQVSHLRDEVKKLEDENSRLKSGLEEANRKYLDCKRD